MSRKLNSVSAVIAFSVLLLAAASAMAQVERVRSNNDDAIGRTLTLACCKCLGGSNTLDLSTISSNSWIVNGNSVAFLTAVHPLWNLPTGPASWVSTVASGGTGSVAAGPYEYKLKFVVPACAIEQRVSLTGNYGGDDDVVGVFLDNVTNSTSSLLASCSGGWCFNSNNNSNPRTFTTNVPPGNYYLRIKIQNNGGPSGMFVNAKLTSNCRN